MNQIVKLGSKTEYQLDKPDKNILETFENKHLNNIYLVTFTQERDEFSSLCVLGDTKIDVATNEIENPKGIPIQELVGTEGIVFGFDINKGIPVARRYYFVRKTQENVPVVEIELKHISCTGPGKFSYYKKMITCTPDHLVLISAGWHKFKWVKAKDLKEGMRCIADQRSTDAIRSISRHRMIMECILDRSLKEGELPHHKDSNHFNNNPENLQLMSGNSEHHRLHRHNDYGYESTLDVPSLIELYNEGENFASIAKMYNCDPSTIESRISHLVARKTQSESLLTKPESVQLRGVMKECKEYYEIGYTTYELAEFYNVHMTTISQWIEKSGGIVRTSLQTKEIRKNKELPSLNHRVVSVKEAGLSDVYNMEVEDVENFFGNGVVLHNCPVTHQPDFANIEILYVPNKKMVESKSLKLYFFSFRNNGEFHEDVINRMHNDLWELLQPKYLRVFGNFAARGGIAIKPLVEKYELKKIHSIQINHLIESWDRKNATN